MIHYLILSERDSVVPCAPAPYSNYGAACQTLCAVYPICWAPDYATLMEE